MDQKLPSEKLQQRAYARRHPVRFAGILAVTVVAAAGVVFGGTSLVNALTPAPVPTATLTPYVATLSPSDLSDTQAAADAQQATIAAQAAADALAAQQAADAAAQAAKDAAKKAESGTTWTNGNAPAGTPIPLHLDSDPNSGSYGQMVIVNPDQFCASNGGTTGPNGVQVCS